MPVTPEGLIPPMPDVRFGQTNGIRMAVYEAGPADGTPVVLVHGFPELAYSWRHQIKALGDAGFRVIAPDMRGYGLTDRPEPVEAYALTQLTADLTGLLDMLGVQRAVFAGHDWGGIVVWALPLVAPQRVLGVIGLNTPFIARPPVDPIDAMRTVFGDEMYIVHFQKLGEADAVLGADPAKSVRFFMRRGNMKASDFEKRPKEERNFALVRALQSDEANWPGEVLLNSAELSVFTESFARTGFTGGINWYRNWSYNWRATQHLKEHVPHPALMIMAEDDVVLRPSMADGMERYVPDLDRHLIRECGHWTQQEKPAETSEVMIAWLRKRFG